jgi:lipopolysaccharide/colanic/teichoic acid biosynthesis glycosyltransferase
LNVIDGVDLPSLSWTLDLRVTMLPNDFADPSTAMLNRRPARQYGERARRIGDLSIALAVIAIALPLMGLVALALKLESRGPVFVRHSCLGTGGRRFQILRFRNGISHAGPCEEKLSGVGQWLRWSRIEVLPEIFNVMRGEISILDAQARSPSFLA